MKYYTSARIYNMENDDENPTSQYIEDRLISMATTYNLPNPNAFASNLLWLTHRDSKIWFPSHNNENEKKSVRYGLIEILDEDHYNYNIYYYEDSFITVHPEHLYVIVADDWDDRTYYLWLCYGKYISMISDANVLFRINIDKNMEEKYIHVEKPGYPLVFTASCENPYKNDEYMVWHIFRKIKSTYAMIQNEGRITPPSLANQFQLGSLLTDMVANSQIGDYLLYNIRYGQLIKGFHLPFNSNKHQRVFHAFMHPFEGDFQMICIKRMNEYAFNIYICQPMDLGKILPDVAKDLHITYKDDVYQMIYEK